MSIESPYFTIAGQTKDFICLRLNLDATFNGEEIRRMDTLGAMEFNQHLLDIHGLVVADKHFSTLVCRKWISPSDLIDKLQRQGVI
jgi:hypothetical protein